MTRRDPAPTTRRTFIKQGSATLAGASLLSASVFAGSRQQPLRVALVGCGGRGAGAASQALSTREDVKLVAMADAFSDRLEGTHAELTKRHADRMDVPPERRYVGFDAFEKAMTDDVEVVILATPPGFRPLHFEHAVSLGKHVFMEKPVAVDAPGVRRVLQAAVDARAKNLKVGVGLQRHHSARYQETVKRIQDGEIGDPLLLRCYWNGGGVWTRARKPGMTEMEYQMRNWYYFNWLCGDHIVEQHIHNLDVGCWVKDMYPVEANGMGGGEERMSGDDTKSQIFDHTFVEYTFPDGTKMYSQGRHLRGGWGQINEFAHGSKGTSRIGHSIMPFGKDIIRMRGKGGGHQQEQHDLVEALVAGKIYNEGDYGAMSTFTAIPGREACYSGKKLNAKELLEEGRDYCPGIDKYTMDTNPPAMPDAEGHYPVAVPGEYDAKPNKKPKKSKK